MKGDRHVSSQPLELRKGKRKHGGGKFLSGLTSVRVMQKFLELPPLYLREVSSCSFGLQFDSFSAAFSCQPLPFLAFLAGISVSVYVTRSCFCSLEILK